MKSNLLSWFTTCAIRNCKPECRTFTFYCMSTNKNDYYHLGLTDDEVLQSREKNGINLLTPPKRPSLWKLY